MFFKKKDKKVTWKAEEEFFSVYVNQKEIPTEIPSNWLGENLLIFLEKLNKYYLLENYKNLKDNQLREAEYIADGDSILWSKSGDGYYLYENGITINDNSNPFWIEDIMLATYQEKAYLLKDYDQATDDILQEAILINYDNKVHWIKADEHFYLLYKGKLLDLNHTANYAMDDLTIFVDDIDALMNMSDYKNRDEYVFYEAFRLAEKDEYVWRKTIDGSFKLFCNEQTLHSNSIATFHNDDAVVYVPDLDASFLLIDLRNADVDEYYETEIISSESNVFWSASDGNYYLIDKGKNIAGKIGNHNSIIGTDLLVYNPETSTTYLFQNYKNLKDDQLRSALILSYSAKTVWLGNQGRYWIWYKGIRTGECEHQYMGDDLMVMPKDLKVMMNLENFRNRQDNRLRVIE